MTYEDILTGVAQEVRDRAWPEPNSSVTEEQLRIAYAAAYAKAATLPIFKLRKEFIPLLGQMAAVKNGYLSYPLPGDTFVDRGDLGIVTHEFEGVEYDVSQSMPINSFRMMASNSFQSGNSGVFSYDSRTKSLNILSTDNTQDVDLYYVPEPMKPTTGDYDQIDLPLPEGELAPTIHMIAAHISGSRLRDSAGTQFQSILNRNYSTNIGEG